MDNDKYIVSFNIAGWAWKHTKEKWEDRLKRACDCIKEEAPDAWLIGLSEVIPGTNDKYIDVIKQEFPTYITVLPEAYKNNYRSAINVLLINKEGYHNHNVRSLENLEDSLLYNYVAIDCDYGYYRVLNAHMPHTNNEDRPEWYRRSRNELRSTFEASVADTCNAYRREPDMQFIFMTDANASPEDAFIRKLSGAVNPVLFNATRTGDRDMPTWENPEYEPNHIDYIFYSMGSMMAPVIDVYYNEIINAPIIEKISDHALIRGKIRTNVNNWCA
ncbi:MAG: hypothetical protein SOY47_14660 [Lachnospiraceae bacterium]|nr:hypothetical protein [Lachnospiraceae bacterium]